MTARPWSTMPVTGAQHDAWMREEREVATVLMKRTTWSVDNARLHGLHAEIERQHQIMRWERGEA